MKVCFRIGMSVVIALWVVAPGARAQMSGTVQRPNVFGRALDGNLLGESNSPEVTIYLPPSYGTDTDRRYPVVYFLHGYGLTDQGYMGPGGPFELLEAADRAFVSGVAEDMIIVAPNGYNRFGGSMYSASITTGDWESYIADDLVDYVDANYRTIPSRESRGLSGHSMGGYGTLRIGMKRPDVYAALYQMAACCLMNGQGGGRAPGGGVTPEQAEEAQAGRGGRGRGRGGFNTAGAQSAAWAPNPFNPPDYSDPLTVDGEVQPEIAALFHANSPLVMVPQYVTNLKKYRAIAGDVGLDDGLSSTNIRLAELLDALGVGYDFDTFDGDHTNRVAERFETIMLPFFSEVLEFGE